jgi:glycosyltransferase-like protein
VTFPLQIALFTYSTKLRGSVVHTLELAEALHKLGHEVCVYALSKDGKTFDYRLSCRTCLIPTQPAPEDIDRLIRQRIQEFVDYLNLYPPRCDIYHAQDCLSANALAHLRQQGAIPHFIRTVHHIEAYPSPYLRECQDRSIRDADLCLCVSTHWQRELGQQYQIQAGLVSNGVNLHHFSPQRSDTEALLRKRWNLSGSPIYLTVGGIEPRKNSIALVKAFALLKQELPNAQLIIAGGETLFDYHTYREEFFAWVEQLGVGDALVLPGVISEAELPALYRLADAFVFPSLKEGWGLVVLEAIASGLPVLTSDQPPFTEFLKPTQALLVNPESAGEIAAGMRAMVQPERSQSLIEKSQSLLSYYTWETSAQRHLQYYNQLCRC